MVLRAANCWDSWHEAMQRLKSLGLEKETAKRWLEQAYWQATRIPDAEYIRVTTQITREGLRGGTVRLHVDSWDDGDALLMMIWTPPSDFTHLLSDVGLQERRGAILIYPAQS